jgi:hypothetical protein
MKKTGWKVLLVGISGILAASIFGCGHSKFGTIIPPKKFVNVLTDIHLADGIAVNNMAQVLDAPIDSASLYQSVFDKYDVTRAMFDSTLVYYSQHPDDFQKIYNKVNARLKRMEDQLDAVNEKNKAKVGAPVDTILKK